MIKINQITEKYKDLQWMRHEHAIILRNFILENRLKNLCELGFLHGKSSVYIGAILEEQGFGKLTTFDIIRKNKKRIPEIYDLIKEFSLENYIDVIESTEGYLWDLFPILQNKTKTFDFCYIDGEHTYESTALAFYFIDQLIEPNGIILFDDYSWSINKSISNDPKKIKNFPHWIFMTDKQKNSKGVKMVCDVLLPLKNYELLNVPNNVDWKFFKKIRSNND